MVTYDKVMNGRNLLSSLARNVGPLVRWFEQTNERPTNEQIFFAKLCEIHRFIICPDKLNFLKYFSRTPGGVILENPP